MWSLLADETVATTAMWIQYREQLARDLTDRDWKAVDSAYLGVTGMIWNAKTNQDIKPEAVSRVVDSVRHALAALEPRWPVHTGGLAPDPQPPYDGD